MIKTINSTEFHTKINETRLFVILFGGELTLCRDQVLKMLNNVAISFDTVGFNIIDVYKKENTELRKQLDITQAPCCVFFENGEEANRLTTHFQEDDIVNIITQLQEV